MITGAAQMDGRILVESATDSPMPQTKRTYSACKTGKEPFLFHLFTMCFLEMQELPQNIAQF